MSVWHTHDLPDMQVIDTQATQLALASFDMARATGRPELFHGHPGTGKGFTAHLIATAHPQLRRIRIQIHLGLSDYRVGVRLARALHLLEIPNGADELLDVLAAALTAAGAVLLVIDEAQFLNKKAAEYLRILSELVPPSVSFLYLGGHRCIDTLREYKGAFRRIEYEVEFLPLDSDTIIAEIPKYHPLWRNTDAELIAEIYDRLQETGQNGGILGEWARLTRISISICARANLDTIDAAVAQTAFALCNKPWPNMATDERRDDGDDDHQASGE